MLELYFEKTTLLFRMSLIPTFASDALKGLSAEYESQNIIPFWPIAQTNPGDVGKS